MRISTKRVARFLSAILLLPLLSATPSAVAAGVPQTITASQNAVTGLASISWTAPTNTETLTGYVVYVDAAGAGKFVYQELSASKTSTVICFPFNGNTIVSVASITDGVKPSYTDNNPSGTHWRSTASTPYNGGGSCSTVSSTAPTYNYSISYDANGGSGSMLPVSGNGWTVTLDANTFTNGAQTFQGWATSSGGSVAYNDSATITLSSTTTLTLYAKWSGSTSTINYNAGTGGSGSGPTSPLSVNLGDTFTVPSNTFTNSGYSFVYWSDGADTFTVGTTYPKTGTVSSGPVTLTANWSANKYVYDSNTATSGTAISDQVYAGSQLTAEANTYTAPTGYEFDGWCTVQLAVGTSSCSGGTKYAAGANLPAPASATVTLYAVWKSPTPSGGGGGSAPAPVYVPKPPTITSISAPEVCAVTSQLTIKGTNLASASVKVDGVSSRVVSASSTEIIAALPGSSVGTKTITVTNDDGSATTTVKYVFQDTPIFTNFSYPETFKNREFKYTFSADAATKYEISGVLPSGLTLNSATGEITGAPSQEGDYVFTIVASNLCDSAPLLVYMFVDKPIPAAFTCSVAFNNPRTDAISEIKMTNLKNCLTPVPSLSPKYVKPVIFLSGGISPGLTAEQALTHPRYLPIISLIESMNLEAQIYYGAFSGSTDSVQLNVYWPDPS